MGEDSSVSGGPPESSRQAGPSWPRLGSWVILSIMVLSLAVFLMGCGLVSGDGEPEEAGEAGDDIRAEI
ncbi:MAG: hypothetical protein BZY88_16400 [SAR202 cluster bacterium Io17-Chloro-G9]|nr:MAG: hypothetical protein BZY88_16400 [SAR202 cluster bacterium Io17-Chloro-G9]